MAGFSYAVVGRRAGGAARHEPNPTNDAGEPATSTPRAGRTVNPYCLGARARRDPLRPGQRAHPHHPRRVHHHLRGRRPADQPTRTQNAAAATTTRSSTPQPTRSSTPQHAPAPTPSQPSTPKRPGRFRGTADRAHGWVQVRTASNQTVRIYTNRGTHWDGCDWAQVHSGHQLDVYAYRNMLAQRRERSSPSATRARTG
jgi:hypothetical protein